MRPFPKQEIKPWKKTTEFYDGMLTITKGLDETGKRFGHAQLHDPKPLYDALGLEMGRRAHVTLAWALATVEFGPNSPFPYEEAGVPEGLIREVRKVEDRFRGTYWQVYLPTLGGDIDGTYTGWYTGPNDDGNDPEVAFLLGLISWASGCLYWDNSPPPLRLNTRAKDKAHWEKQPWPAEIVEDSGWKSWEAGRCYWQFTRTLKFERVLSDDEVETFKKKLFATERGPGVGDPYVKTDDNQTFALSGARDSSD